MESASSDKRLAKNTIVLYIRTLLTMFIGLYTSRALLAALGVDNYGIYNVVGGFVGMFGVITGTLVATTQRYLNVEIGKGETGDTKKIFGVVMGIHFILAIFMMLIFETVGLWFLNTQMSIPEGRMYAANWVFQLSVLSSVLSLFSTPYIGVIVAYERMTAFAFISLQDAILKLAICFLLYIIPYDHLIVYATLFWIVMMWDQLLYIIYSHKNFKEARITIVKERSIYKEMFGFAGLNFIGTLSYVLCTSGVNVILNIFFGVVVNAARAIAGQVQAAVGKFVGDFMTALNPQITKEYASGNREKSITLCFRGAKFSYFLMFIFALPIMIRSHEILTIWLDKYPDYTVPFLNYTIWTALVGVIASPFVTVLLATGNLKTTTWWIGGTRLLDLPLIYLAFKIWNDPIWAYIIVLAMDILIIFVRIHLLEGLTEVKIMKGFLSKVFLPLAIATCLSYPVTLLGDLIIPTNLWGLLLYCGCSCVCTAIIIYYVGLSSTEKSTIVQFIKNKIFKIFQKG